MHGSENWAVDRSGRRKTETVEMRFLRHVSGYKITDQVCDTRRKYYQCVSEEGTQDYKNTWHNHNLRMDLLQH
jgi:hypothetical protein